MYALTIAGGSTMSFPDTCNTLVVLAVVPTPYPNIAQMVMGTPPTSKILIGGMPALTKKSKVPLSSGDEAGVTGGGGVLSGKFIGEMIFMLASMTVTFEGQGAVRLNEPVDTNNGNAPMMGTVTAPSQTTVTAGG